MGRTWAITDAQPAKVVGAITGAHCLSHFYLLVFPPLFPMLKREFALSNTELGLIISVGIVGPLLFQLPLGRAVDSLGAKWVLVVGLMVTGVGTALVGLADSYLVVLAFAALAGLGQATFHPADYALLEAVATSDTKGRNFSVHTFGGYVGYAVAPVVVGTLAIVFDWRLALLVAGGAGVVYALGLSVGLASIYTGAEADEHGVDADDDGADEFDDSAAPETSLFRRPALLGLFGFALLITMALKGIQTFSPLFLVETYGFSETVGNTALTAFFVAAAAGVLSGGPLADRFAGHRIITPALLAVAALLWVVAGGFVPPLELVVLAVFALIGFLAGLILPARDRAISDFSGSAGAGESFGFVFTGLALGSFVSPALLGALIDATSIVPAFLAIGAFYVLAVVVLLGSVRLPRDGPATA